MERQNPPCDNLESAALNELVAQLVEQRPFKAWVLGSSPSELTIQNKELTGTRPDFQKAPLRYESDTGSFEALFFRFTFRR